MKPTYMIVQGSIPKSGKPGELIKKPPQTEAFLYTKVKTDLAVTGRKMMPVKFLKGE